MKRTIHLAFAALAFPLLAMAQSPDSPPAAPAPGKEKPVIPGAPVPAPEAPPVVPPKVPPVPMPVPDLPAVPPVPMPVPSLPAVPPAPMPNPGLPPVPVTPAPAQPEKPDRPNSKRPGNSGAKGKADRPGMPVPVPAAPEADPKPQAEPPAPIPGMKAPTAPPAVTGGSIVTPPTAPATPGTRPFPGKKPKDRKGRPFDPAQTPPPGPATPPPAVTPAPAVPVEPKIVERPVAQKPPSKETTQVLEDQGKRDRKADAKQAEKIEDKEDAKRLLMTILGGGAIGAAINDRQDQARPGNRPGDRPGNFPGDRPGDRQGDRFRQGYRPSFEEVGRTQQDRERNVGLMVQRFQGRAPQIAPPPAGNFQRDPRNFEINPTHRSFETNHSQRYTQFYEGNRRVIRYSSMQEIPPIIVASQQLNRVRVVPLAQSAYTVRPQGYPQGQYLNEVPQAYTDGNAYAVSYGVDPESAISTNDILFRQGSTDFADAYSYDLVIDVAEAMNTDALLKETFVVEGHASAEGDYAQNLLLSQERAERISRELVRHGVSAERLMPVGYGETEAAHPANAGESERRLDRRVMVFRMR